MPCREITDKGAGGGQQEVRGQARRRRTGALSDLISKGKAAAKTILKARILLKADQSEAGEGWSDEAICKALDTNITMVERVRAKLVDEGLDAVLTRKKRETPPIAPIFDGEKQAQLIALACSQPPRRLCALDDPAAGRARR